MPGYSIWYSEVITSDWYKIQMGYTRSKKHAVIRDQGEWERNRGYFVTPIPTAHGRLDYLAHYRCSQELCGPLYVNRLPKLIGNSEAICSRDDKCMHVCYNAPSDSIIEVYILTLKRVFKAFDSRFVASLHYHRPPFLLPGNEHVFCINFLCYKAFN